MSTTVATSLSKLYKLSTFPRRKSLWPEPEVSIDTWYRSMGSCECWEAIGQARDVFIALSKEIKDLLERRSDYLSKGESIPHSITFGIYMIGRTKESANPTIIFSCREASPRQRAREIIQESGILDKHPGIRVGDTTYPPEFDQAPRLLASDDMIIRTTGIGEVKKTILCYSSNNLYGRQIFLRGYDGNGASLRKATAGGIFVSQGRFFYQTVAHAFTKTIEYAEYIDDPSFKFDIDSNGSDTDEGNKLMDTSRESLTSSCSDLDETKLSEEPWSSVSLQDQNRLRNSGRIYNETDNTTVETGPLPPDFESRIWHHDNAGEPYIVLGDLFMSSLGRPCASLDWALIEIKDLAFLRAYEEHLLSTDTNKPFESPKRIGNLGSDNVHILAMTGSSGLLSGTLSGSPTFKTSPGCHTFQEVWTVRLEGNISNGDCGSWVIDARTGDLYGYIISGDLSSGVAHIVPAFQAVESMKQCLGNDVKLLTKRHLRAKQGNIQLNEHVTFGGGRPSFLFRIDRLEPTFASQAPQLDFYPWSLPLRGDQYNRWPGILYRWREGFVTPVLQHEPMPTLTLDSSSPLCYSSASILSEHPNGAQCLAVDFDVTKKTEFDHWCSPAFHHIPFQGQEHFKYSYLDFTAEYGYLAAPDQSSDKWMSNLFPDEFQYHPQNASDPVPTSAGVAGRLSLLLAFAAFSCREEHLDYVLRTSLRPFKWIPHGFKPSCKSFPRASRQFLNLYFSKKRTPRHDGICLHRSSWIDNL